MNYKLLFCLILFPALVFSQGEARKLLLGKIVAESMDVENITVLNKSTNIIALTDNFGKFAIFARENDTLIFSSMTFSSKVLAVDENDFDELLKIRLDVVVNQLDEVIIQPFRLSGDLNADSKKFKNKQPLSSMKGLVLEHKDYKPDTRTALKNNASMPVMESSLTGINFVKIGKMIGSIFGSPKPKEQKPVQKQSFIIFPEAVKQKFSYHFFTQTLKLSKDEIGLFLNFCDAPEAHENRLLDADKEFELTEYLIKKSKEFHKNK